MKMALRENAKNVKEFMFMESNVGGEIRKRNNWTAAGIDGIQNYWWKRFKTAQKALTRAIERIKNDNDLIPVWWSTARTANPSNPIES